jgi:glutamine amidotransferase
MKKNVVILDYGIGNIKSISNAIIEIGAIPILTNDPNVILSADACILPGVGAFQKGMSNLQSSNLISVIYDFVKTGKPFLGICLGMQLLFDESHEFGISQGLGLINGSVKKMKLHPNSKDKLPHVSWNELYEPKFGRWLGSLLENTELNSDVYFVHSFAATPINEEEILALTNYGEQAICAAVKKNNITGVQFHPEKSGISGLKMLAKYLSI